MHRCPFFGSFVLRASHQLDYPTNIASTHLVAVVTRVRRPLREVPGCRTGEGITQIEVESPRGICPSRARRHGGCAVVFWIHLDGYRLNLELYEDCQRFSCYKSRRVLRVSLLSEGGPVGRRMHSAM